MHQLAVVGKPIETCMALVDTLQCAAHVGRGIWELTRGATSQARSPYLHSTWLIGPFTSSSAPDSPRDPIYSEMRSHTILIAR
jgi:hypothetical protein